MARPRYSACMACYHTPGLDPTDIVRVTVAIVDTRTDKLVDHREWWADDTPEEVMVDEATAYAAQYAASLHLISEPVPLDECPCGCRGYVTVCT